MLNTYDGAVDKGLEGVIACTTAISYIIDSRLIYRGYTIEDLAENSSFEEVVFLLWNNRLPSSEELKQFQSRLWEKMTLPEDQVRQLQALPNKDVHPMAWLRTATSMLALWDANSQRTDEESMFNVAMELTAKMGILVALLERKRQGQDWLPSNPEKNLAWNFLYMLQGTEPSSEMVKIFDTCLILHADHELNCSAFTARVTASSLSDIYSGVVSAIGALKGPLHGGANEQVMRTLKKIGSVENAETWVKEALARKEKIMGFGHRVYKNGDPRAKILRGMSEQLNRQSGEGKWYEISKIIDDTVQGEKGLLPMWTSIRRRFTTAWVFHWISTLRSLLSLVSVVGWLTYLSSTLKIASIAPEGSGRGRQA